MTIESSTGRQGSESTLCSELSSDMGPLGTRISKRAWLGLTRRTRDMWGRSLEGGEVCPQDNSPRPELSSLQGRKRHHMLMGLTGRAPSPRGRLARTDQDAWYQGRNSGWTVSMSREE